MWPMLPLRLKLWHALLGFALYGVMLVLLTSMVDLVPALSVVLQTQWATPVQNLLIALAALAVLAWPRGALAEQAPLHPAPWPRFFIVVIAITLAITLFALWFESTVPGAREAGDQVAQSFGLGRSVWTDLAVILGTVVMAPLGEEMIFRALIFRGLRDGLARWIGLQPAVIVATLASAFLFAIAHGGEGQDAQIAALLVTGGLLALSYELTGTLAAPILVHSLNNMLALSQAVSAGPNVGFAADGAMLAVYGAPVVLLAGLALARRASVR